jgi:addiction module RelE/StbE family toxin
MEIFWRPSAVEDIEPARHYIAQFNPGAAVRIFAALCASVRTLADFPQRGRLGRVEGTRELVVPRTPCLIAYTVIGQQLVILAVLHHAREWPTTL